MDVPPGKFFHPCQSLLLGHSGMKWVSSIPGSSLSSGSKAAVNNHFSSNVGCCIVATTRTTNGTPVLHSFIYWDVSEPTCHPCSTTGMLHDNHLLQLGVTGDIYSLNPHDNRAMNGYGAINRLCSQVSVSDPTTSALISFVALFHLFSGYLPLLCLFGLCLCLEFVLFRLWKTPGFLLFTCSNNVRIADRAQDVLMTVRASSVRHEPKKNG